MSGICFWHSSCSLSETAIDFQPCQYATLHKDFAHVKSRMHTAITVKAVKVIIITKEKSGDTHSLSDSFEE